MNTYGVPSIRAIPVMAVMRPVQNVGHVPGNTSAGSQVDRYGERTASGVAGGRIGWKVGAVDRSGSAWAVPVTVGRAAAAMPAAPDQRSRLRRDTDMALSCRRDSGNASSPTEIGLEQHDHGQERTVDGGRRRRAVLGDVVADQVLDDGQQQHAGRGAQDGTRATGQQHTSELQSQSNLVCRLLLEKKKKPHGT